jgi:hypothetical protein
MFRNRSFQVKMVKDATASATDSVSLDYEKIDEIVREYTRNAAVGAVLLYAAFKTIYTASEIAINRSAPRR